MKAVLFLASMIGAYPGMSIKKYIFVNQNLSWNAAQAYCRSKYIDLSTVETNEDLAKFKQDIRANCLGHCWIGLSRPPNTLNFTLWSDGSVSVFRYWSQNQPSKDHSKNCVYARYYWFSDDCANPHNFVCYTVDYPLVVVQEMMTWEEALRYCRTNYTDLVSLVTETDHLAVSSMSNHIQTPSFWTGLCFLDGSLFWVNQATESPGNFSFMPSCPAPRVHCGAGKAGSDVLENRDCEERMNFICYNQN